MGKRIQVPTEERFWSKVDVRGSDECWEWCACKNHKGYGQFWFDGKLVFSHRFSYQLHAGTKIPEGLQVNHHCDNRLCVNPAHLYLGTAKQNSLDMMSRGRGVFQFVDKQTIGEKNGNSKLKDCEAREVKRLALDGRLPQWFIGAMFKIPQVTVSAIKTGRIWKHV